LFDPMRNGPPGIHTMSSNGGLPGNGPSRPRFSTCGGESVLTTSPRCRVTATSCRRRRTNRTGRQPQAESRRPKSSALARSHADGGVVARVPPKRGAAREGFSITKSKGRQPRWRVLEQIARDAGVRRGEDVPAPGRSGLQSRRDQMPAPPHQPRTAEKPVSSRPITRRCNLGGARADGRDLPVLDGDGLLRGLGVIHRDDASPEVSDVGGARERRINESCQRQR
jgi:hypothetical protein